MKLHRPMKMVGKVLWLDFVMCCTADKVVHILKRGVGASGKEHFNFEDCFGKENI